MHLVDVFASDVRAVVRLVNKGQVKATGETMEDNACWILKLDGEGGRIAEVSCPDLTDLFSDCVDLT